MLKKSTDEKFSPLMTVFFPRNTPLSRLNAQHPTPINREQALNVQRSMEPARPRAEDRCAHPSVILSRNWRTQGAGLSRPKWNSLPFARMAGTSRIEIRD